MRICIAPLLLIQDKVCTIKFHGLICKSKFHGLLLHKGVFDLKPYYEVDGYADFIKKMVEWNKKGYISKSDLTTADQKRFETGKSAVGIGNIGNYKSQWIMAKQNHPDWKVEYVNILKDKTLPSSGYLGNGCAFNAKTENIERALMAADLLGYDPDINFLINYGIDGVHSKIAGKVNVDGTEYRQIGTVESGAGKYGGFSSWCFTNSLTFPVEEIPNYNEIAVSYFFKQKIIHPLNGLSLATDAVNAEIARVSEISSKYYPILTLGFNNDPEATLKEFIAETKAAGVDKINEELTRQAREVFDAAQ